MSTRIEMCPICGEGHLTGRVEKNLVEYKGEKSELDMLYSVCSCCGSEQTSADQSRKNKRAMQAFKKQVDGLLTGGQIRELRERWRITQAQAARVFGGGPVAFAKYEADDVSQSEAMDKLLRLCSEVPEAFCYLVESAGLGKIIEDEFVSSDSWISSPMGTLQATKRSSLRVVRSSEVMSAPEWRAAS